MEHLWLDSLPQPEILPAHRSPSSLLSFVTHFPCLLFVFHYFNYFRLLFPVPSVNHCFHKSVVNMSVSSHLCCMRSQTGTFHFQKLDPLQHIYFTTHETGSHPNFAARCKTMQSFTFGVEQNLSIPALLGNTVGTASCLSLSQPSPTAQPCTASLSPEKAANISTLLTQSFEESKCQETTPASSCVPASDDSGVIRLKLNGTWLYCVIIYVLLTHS